MPKIEQFILKGAMFVYILVPLVSLVFNSKFLLHSIPHACNYFIFLGKLYSVLLCFSLIKNYEKFVNAESSSRVFRCLHGIRFLTLAWIILAHTYGNRTYHNTYNSIKSVSSGGELAFQIVVNGYFSVDIFFFISGLLVCYWSVKLLKEENHLFTFMGYVCHRLWRFLPLYLPVIMYCFLDKQGSGPIYHETMDYVFKTCPKSWWTNLLFINNFYFLEAQTQCLPHTWYTAADFQLYLIAFPIILLLFRSPKVGVAAYLLGIVLSMLYCAIATYVNGYPPTLLYPLRMNAALHMKYLSQFYVLPFPHAGPYFIGMLAGYLLVTQPNLKIPRKLQAMAWPVAFVMCSYVLFGSVNWNRGIKPSVLESVLFASFSRVIWSLGFGCVIVCCITGHGGFINSFLSWKVFVPLSRISYAVYLVHPFVLRCIVSQILTPLNGSHLFIIWMYLGNLCVTYVVAFAASMLFEYPIISLCRVLIQVKKKDD